VVRQGTVSLLNSVDYDGFVASNFEGLRDQIHATYGLKVNFVWEADF